MTDEQIRVLLVDDHELILQGLSAAFGADPGTEIVGTAATVASALEAAGSLRPRAVVTDLQLPDGSGLDIVRELRRQDAEMGLVVLTMHSGDEQIFAAMEAGASAFVGKDAPATDVVRATKHASVSPRTFLCAGLAEAVQRRASGNSAQLNERERDILAQLAEGLGSSAIAKNLYMSESTVKAAITRIYQKLGAMNRAQALVIAMRTGLLDVVTPPRFPFL